MWYEKYCNRPYIHLGNDLENGIDCFNLCSLIYKEQKNIIIPYETKDFCFDKNVNWYNNINYSPFGFFNNEAFGWESVNDITIFDIVTMSIGSTNYINHCAIVVDKNKLLQIRVGKNSYISPYGAYYQQYTTGIYRWIGNIDENNLRRELQRIKEQYGNARSE